MTEAHTKPKDPKSDEPCEICNSDMHTTGHHTTDLPPATGHHTTDLPPVDSETEYTREK